VTVAVAGASTLAASVAVTAEELGDFHLQRGLQQQTGAEPGDVFQDLAKVAVGGEQLVDLGADALHRGYSCRHGRGPPIRVGSSAGSLRPSYFSTAPRTPPSPLVKTRS
jgi:hypothetical protein